MTPKNYDGEILEFKEVTYQSKTYKMDFENGTISGFIDNLNALKQSIYKIISTIRFKHIIYSRDYGFEMDRVFNKTLFEARGILPSLISDALMVENRIISVEDFVIESIGKTGLKVTFKVGSVYGDFEVEREFDIYVWGKNLWKHFKGNA